MGKQLQYNLGKTSTINKVQDSSNYIEGNLYYDSEEKKHYVYKDGKLEPFGVDIEIISNLDAQFTPQEGKIYYNQYDYSYYTYNGEFNKIGKETVDVITNIDDVPQQTPVEGTQAWNSYVLSPNVFYNIANWDRIPSGSISNTSMVFDFNPADGIYAGRFTAWADDMNITWPAGVIIPDSVDTTIVNGHTYEFNVWQDVLILTDITATGGGA